MIRPLAFASLLFASALFAQAPHESWRTITTAHFRVHYPRQYEAWATRAASRLESVRAAVVSEVGFAPETVTDVIVENPIADPNGETIPLLDSPRIVLYPEAPEPEMVIGEYSDWIDLLTVHETAHLIHLLRPSRNPFDRAIAHLLPLNPITLHAPRWVLEGYATVIEGRITGSGRPSGAMRAAVLRTWAMNGQLPTYAQLNSDSRFLGGSMAYLAGSAFLEWLVQRSGPDSLHHLWARMTARQRRSFDSAFTGVFGDSPARLYGRFSAELSENAMTLVRAGGWREGELWQETSRGSGDPAVSPDGSKLAMVLRDEKGQAKLVVYSTGANEEEAKAEKRIAEMLQRDPEDVAPVRTKPLPRKPEHSYQPFDGGDIENPRWTGDGAAIVYTHKQPDCDGFLHHDLFRWTPLSGRNERLTHLADVKDADPIDAAHAVAVRNRFGASQIVIVDLNTGSVTPRTEPSLDIVYSHPRVAADGRIAWAEHAHGEWHVAIDGKPLPVAGAFAPEWGRDGALFAAVAGRGFIDIAKFETRRSDSDKRRSDSPVRQDGSVRQDRSVGLESPTYVNQTYVSPTYADPAYITRSSGMAIDPAPSPDGALYFMSIEPQGFVVRSLAETTPAPQPTLTFDRSLVPALPPPPATPVALRDEPVTSNDYGIGLQEWRSLFGGQYTAFGHTTELGIRLGDVIGRLDTILIGAFGSRSMPRGAAIASTWRGLPIALGAHLFDAHETRGIEVRATREATFPLARISISGGGLFERSRNRAFIDAHAVTWQRRIASQQIDIAADSANHLRATARAAIRAGALTLGAQLSAGRHLTLGGTPSTIEPDSLLIEHLLDPAFERDSFSSPTHRGERLSIGTSGLTAFWQRHHLGADIDLLGIETNASIPAMPLVKTPALQLTAGVAQVRMTHKIRGWVGVRWKP
jgi:Tol biopolymer transport system component